MRTYLAILVTSILEGFLEHPEEVEILETVAQENVDHEPLVVVTLLVYRDDIGKILGRRGRMANALRTILGAASRAHREIALLDLPQVDDPSSRVVREYYQNHSPDRGTHDEAAA